MISSQENLQFFDEHRHSTKNSANQRPICWRRFKKLQKLSEIRGVEWNWEFLQEGETLFTANVSTRIWYQFLVESTVLRNKKATYFSGVHHSSPEKMAAAFPEDRNGENPKSALIFLGTGCSSAVPNVFCLIQPSDPPCQVCTPSLSITPHENPNYRCNTSLLIDYYSEGNHKYILIDVGKTFREQVLRWFPRYKIPQVDSIILTHEHADAVLGLDDVRVVQPFSPTNDIDPTPVYLTQASMQSIAVKFPYLVQKKAKPGQEIRRVAQFEWQIIHNDHRKQFEASGLRFSPLPVMHGEDYVCLGFLFGDRCKVAYISDISRFLPTTEQYISKEHGQQLDLLILDTLYKNGSHNTHFCFPQTLDAVKRICPKRALLIGMTHEFDHHKDNEFLRDWSSREGIPVQLAHDGLRIAVDL